MNKVVEFNKGTQALTFKDIVDILKSAREMGGDDNNTTVRVLVGEWIEVSAIQIEIDYNGETPEPT